LRREFLVVNVALGKRVRINAKQLLVVNVALRRELLVANVVLGRE
jgi:hypothetical protein